MKEIPFDNETVAEAIAEVQKYLKRRKQYRKILISVARALVDEWSAEKRRDFSSEVRKLHRYPSDLSDQRLLDLVLGNTVKKGQS